jgi:DNA polymerase Ligase (LigD)
MPRFVILEHDHPELHWDFMLEAGGALRTWRLARPPEMAGAIIDAVALADHRLAYLDYEGPVSGGRGSVKRWDAGHYEHEADALRLDGMRVRGVVRLTALGGDRWHLAVLPGVASTG